MYFFLPAAIAVLAALIPSTVSSAAVPLCHASSYITSISSTIKTEIPIQPIVTYTPPTVSIEACVTKIFDYNGGGFENLALRSSSIDKFNILATIAFPEPLLFYIDPLSIRPGVILHNFTSSLTNNLGITELAHDIFYVSGSTATGTANGSSSTIYSVDMRPFLILPNGTILTQPIIKEIGRVPGASLNGMTRIHRSDNFVLSSDSILGGVWKTDVDTGSSEVVIKDPSMAGSPGKTQFAAFGINGLRVWGGELFYCNSGAQTFWRMSLNPDASPAGPATLIASGISCDDFTLQKTPRGLFAYVASPSNALLQLDIQTGAQLVVAGTFNESSSDIISASNARFGLGDSDGGRGSVYVTTNGGAFVGAPLGSQGVSRVDVGHLW